MSNIEGGFAAGQRVINESDPQLGLGYVIEVISARHIKIGFPAKAEERTYNLDTAPLRRIILGFGQNAVSRDGRSLCIEKIESQGNGLVSYLGGGAVINEQDLEDKVPLASSLGRMRYGSVGYAEDMQLRLDSHKLRAKMLNSETYFLGASRTSLLPHQLYVARQVCAMRNPRVLLSDEVGLGKTIEAGMIFSAMRAMGRAQRVLVVLPDGLAHQWLAEMARRFNEVFNLVTSEAISEETNPYFGASRAITPWSALQEGLLDLATEYEWDLLIIDEAHHLCKDRLAYGAVSELARRTRSMLLLTATPSRGGLEAEFKLLSLVDPQRFSDFAAYCSERGGWKEGADLARVLSRYASNDPADTVKALDELAERCPGDAHIAELSARCREALLADVSSEECAAGFRALLAALVDRHGPGRVFFRNRRDNLQYLFCGRHLNPVPLSVNPIENVFPGVKDMAANSRQDPRLLWIVSYVCTHPHEKVVIIANRMQLVAVLHERLRDTFGIHSAMFHEGLSVFDRDKQAVWFSDPEGADVLLCSEIGSEGRNFQTAHTLIFWDIPLRPDVIEQRIGRLDRIGQSQPVDIYVLFLKGRVEERLYAWHKVMGSFDGPVPGGDEIVEQTDLKNCLASPDFKDVVIESHRLGQEYRREAEENADFLVNLNSFDETIGNELKESIGKEDASFDLEQLIVRLMERFKINVETMDTPGLYHIAPGKTMQIDTLAHLRSEGELVTFDRSLALAREDVEYLTGAHPLVKELLSCMLDGTDGCASVVEWKNAPRNGLLIEYLFIFEAIGPDSLELGRYLAPQPLRIKVDLASGKFVKDRVPAGRELKRLKGRDVSKLWEKIGVYVEHRTKIVADQVQKAVGVKRKEALAKAREMLESERMRLEELSKINPLVDEAQIAVQKQCAEAVYAAINDAFPRLDSMRLVHMKAAPAGSGADGADGSGAEDVPASSAE